MEFMREQVCFDHVNDLRNGIGFFMHSSCNLSREGSS